MPSRFFAFIRKKPLEWIIFSSSAGSAPASARAFGYFLNSAGVIVLIVRSVDCADRIVATTSWYAFV